MQFLEVKVPHNETKREPYCACECQPEFSTYHTSGEGNTHMSTHVYSSPLSTSPRIMVHFPTAAQLQQTTLKLQPTIAAGGKLLLT